MPNAPEWNQGNALGWYTPTPQDGNMPNVPKWNQGNALGWYTPTPQDDNMPNVPKWNQGNALGWYTPTPQDDNMPNAPEWNQGNALGVAIHPATPIFSPFSVLIFVYLCRQNCTEHENHIAPGSLAVGCFQLLFTEYFGKKPS
jgi:hypothetical protein